MKLNVENDKKRIFVISFIHFILSCVCEKWIFVSIFDNAGSENIAVKFLSTGKTLQYDSLSRWICFTYAHVLAFLFIVIFWTWIFKLLQVWKEKTIKQQYFIAYLTAIVLGLLMIIIVYPQTVIGATDTTWNYVYAKEWLPIYWHGFFTNVLHCACMIVFPHPIAMSVIPFLFGMNGVCYFTYLTMMKQSSKHTAIKVIGWSLFLILMPETFLVLSYAGRNYIFALLSICYIGIFITDYSTGGGYLDKNKFAMLSCIAVLIGTWRSEGIIYLFFFPVLLYFTYFYKKEKKINKKACLKAVAFICILFIILWLPGKYGSEKYQGYDYVIMNTPGPLSAVLADEHANLSYKGAEDDLNEIYSVIPKEYFEKYGSQAMGCYAYDNLRSPRSSGGGGRDYVIASYRLLFHNWSIYLKNQINYYTESIGLRKFFNLQEVEPENWSLNATEDAYEYFQWIWSYFDTGKTDISANYDFDFINKYVDEFLRIRVTKLLSDIYNIGWKLSGPVKIAVSIMTIISFVYAFFKKKWTFFFIGILILGVQLAVILTAPCMRENYYYSSYFNQYWYLLFVFKLIKNEKNKEKNEMVDGL